MHGKQMQHTSVSVLSSSTVSARGEEAVKGVATDPETRQFNLGVFLLFLCLLRFFFFVQ